MDAKEYISDATVTDLMDYKPVIERLQNVQTLRVLHAAMGLCTESGELMDAVKKYLIYGKDVDVVNLQEEAGDLFWYAALLADACNFTFEDTFEKNIAKLRARYPFKFTEEAALNRNLDKERQILEGK